MFVVAPNHQFRHDGSLYSPGAVIDDKVLGKRAEFLQREGAVLPLKAKSGKALAKEARKAYFDAARALMQAEDNNLEPEKVQALTDDQLASRFGETALAVPDDADDSD